MSSTSVTSGGIDACIVSAPHACRADYRLKFRVATVRTVKRCGCFHTNLSSGRRCVIYFGGGRRQAAVACVDVGGLSRYKKNGPCGWTVLRLDVRYSVSDSFDSSISPLFPSSLQQRPFARQYHVKFKDVCACLVRLHHAEVSLRIQSVS